MIISFATIIVFLRKRHLSVLPAGECRHKMTWRIPVPLSFLACRGIVRRFLVRLCKSNNIFLNCKIIRTKNDHKNRPRLSFSYILFLWTHAFSLFLLLLHHHLPTVPDVHALPRLLRQSAALQVVILNSGIG